MNINERKLLEKLSSIGHEQWMQWAKDILDKENFSSKTRKRWESYFVSYVDLPEDVKDLDRTFAQKSIEIFKKYQKENS